MKTTKLITAAVGALAITAGAAFAASHAVNKLRIQTHFSPETLSGQMAESSSKTSLRCPPAAALILRCFIHLPS